MTLARPGRDPQGVGAAAENNVLLTAARCAPMSAEIAAEDRRSRRQKPRLLPPTTKLMSAEIAGGYFSGRSTE
jgi:hypothetical protein